MHSLIDTFPAFLDYWAEAEHQPLEAQIEGWASVYLARWPELLAKQVQDYAAQGLDWREVARRRVFPYLAERLPAMRQAHASLLQLCGSMYEQARQELGLEAEVRFVLYVGIGCGAGWATRLGEQPAVLFGLEAIAESGWSGRESLAGLAAHELGHLLQHAWRAQHGKVDGEGAWWQLYEEGFAQACESRLLGSAPVHQAAAEAEEDWLGWCQEHAAGLAALFLKTVQAGSPLTAFFGSWYEINGMRETGYFLGQQVVEALVEKSGWQAAALLEDYEAAARPVLERMAGQA
jgi:hypothetical protein